jgi:hypothetical protein
VSDQDAVREADSAVRLTQGSFAPEDVSGFEAQAPFIRMFTMFTGYYNMKSNLGITEFGKVLREQGLAAGFGKLAYLHLVGYLVPLVVSAAIATAIRGVGGPEDEDEDGYLDELVGWILVETGKDAAAMVPGASMFTRAIEGRVEGRRGELSVSPVFDAVNQALGGAIAIPKGFFRGHVTKGEIRDFLTLISLTTGFPVSPIGRAMEFQQRVSGNR